MRAHLPFVTKKVLGIEGGVFILRMTEKGDDDFRSASAIMSKTLEGTESLPLIPHEIEDILTISRQSGIDGSRTAATKRSNSYGETAWTRKEDNFHVFDPRRVEDVLDRDLVTVWRGKPR